jgi:hypothetical protein
LIVYSRNLFAIHPEKWLPPQAVPNVPAGCNKRITEIEITVKIYKIFRTNSIKGAIAG